MRAIARQGSRVRFAITRWMPSVEWAEPINERPVALAAVSVCVQYCQEAPHVKTLRLLAVIVLYVLWSVASALAADETSPAADTGATATAAPATGPANAPAAEDSGPIIEVTPEGVSVFAVHKDVHVVLTELARRTAFRIIVDDTVKGEVTINFRNRKVTEIIRDIAATHGYACREEDGVFTITEGLPSHVSSYLLSDIARVTPNYIPASDAEQLLPVFLQDYTAPSTSQNSVVLSAPPEILEKFRGDVQQFDIPAAQIMIEVLMVEYTKSSAEQFFASLGFNRDAMGGTTDSATGDMAFRVLGDLPDQFGAQLTAFESNGRAHVRANPRISAVSGQQASIFIGERRFLERPVEVSSGEDEDSMTGQQINFINAGVNLKITPWTGGAGEIVALINTEVSTMSAPDAVTGLPEKQTRQAETSVRMLDGQTIVIGGLVSDELIETKSKVPILGDIPLLGKLFRSKHSREVRTELVVFITANTLDQDGRKSTKEATPEASGQAVRP